MPDQESAEVTREPSAPGTTRRGMLRGAAGIGAAGLAAGVLAWGAAAPAGAAEARAASDDARSAAHGEPLVVHIHDARTGVVDVYSGEQHVRLTDRQLAARLARVIN